MVLLFWVAECAVILFFAWYLYHYRAPSITQIEAYVLSRACDGHIDHDAAYYQIDDELVLIPRETIFLKADVCWRLATIKAIAKIDGVSMYTMRRTIWQHAKENGIR